MRCRWLSDMCWSGRAKWEWPCRLQTRRAALAVAVECGWTWVCGSGRGRGMDDQRNSLKHKRDDNNVWCVFCVLLSCVSVTVCVSVFTLWFMYVWCDLFKRTNAKIWFAIKDLPGRNYCSFNCCSSCRCHLLLKSFNNLVYIDFKVQCLFMLATVLSSLPDKALFKVNIGNILLYLFLIFQFLNVISKNVGSADIVHCSSSKQSLHCLVDQTHPVYKSKTNQTFKI